ncbi:aldose 1-epimerase [Vibrio cholerae]
MFKIVKGKFGDFHSTTLLNSKLGICVEIIQDFGAIINQYRVNHSPFSFIVGYQDSQNVIQSHPFFSRSAKLFPFPNRLKNGQYHYQGHDYRLPANFPWSEHAVHGLLYNQPFQVVETDAQEHFATARFRYETDHLADGFPFAFRLDVCYHIDETGRLRCYTEITNTGESPFPYGDAWHPYFSLGDSLAQCQLSLSPHQEVVHCDDLPTGKYTSNTALSSPTTLADVTLNHCYRFHQSSDQSLILTRADQQARLDYQQGANYPFIQLYTPASEPSIAIEPMSCPADAFNNYIGLLELNPEQTAQFEWQCHAHYQPRL